MTSSSYRNNGIVLGFAPIIVIGLIFGLYVNASIGSNNVTTAFLNDSEQGLELQASVNGTTLRVGESLNINIALFNNLSTSNYVSAMPMSSGFKVIGFPIAMWGACLFQQPVEFMIVKGNYNVTQLEPLSNNSSEPSIICMEGGSVNYLVFQPKSEVAYLSGSFCTAECHPLQINSLRLESNFTVNGYWVYPLNRSEAQDVYTPVTGCISNTGGCGFTFNYPEVSPSAQSLFTAGQYTLVVTDEWGQLVLLHFAVV